MVLRGLCAIETREVSPKKFPVALFARQFGEESQKQVLIPAGSWIESCGLQKFCFRMYRGDGIPEEPPDVGFDDMRRDGNRVIGDVFTIQELFPAVTQATRKKGFSAQVVTDVAVEEGMLSLRVFSHEQGRQFVDEGRTEWSLRGTAVKGDLAIVRHLLQEKRREELGVRMICCRRENLLLQPCT